MWNSFRLGRENLHQLHHLCESQFFKNRQVRANCENWNETFVFRQWSSVLVTSVQNWSEKYHTHFFSINFIYLCMCVYTHICTHLCVCPSPVISRTNFISPIKSICILENRNLVDCMPSVNDPYHFYLCSDYGLW